jgi:NMD protein affecting ribosome stability and mRNA decay
MEMMKCPHCGAQNSTRREYCFQCEGALRGEAKNQSRDSVATCAQCAGAAIYPPPGRRITPDQVWCTKKEEAVPSAKVADDCFSEAFGWHRAEILD